MEYIQMIKGLNRNARLFLAHTVLSGLAIALLALIYNLYILSLGFKEDMIGTVTLVACTMAVIAALPLGYVLNRLGYKRALLFALVTVTLSMVLPLLSPTSEALIACEIFWGIGFTLLIIASGPFMTENSDEAERAHLFSIQFVLATLTAFVGNLIGGELPRWFGQVLHAGAESPQAYQAALAVSAGLMLASAIPFLFIRTTRRTQVQVLRPRLTVADPAQTAKLLTPYIIGALAAGMFVPFANVLWKVTQSASDATIGNIFALSALLMAFFGVLSPTLTRRFGQVRVMIIAQGIAVLGLLAFGYSPIFGIALTGFLVRDVLTNMTRPMYSQFMMDHSQPGERAAVSSLATMGFNLAWGISSWLSGTWQTANQFGLVFATSAGLFVLATVTLWWFLRDQNKKPVGELLKHAYATPAE